MNSNKITNLATPTLSTDATTKAYVDANTFTITALSQYIRTGTIQVGNIGNYNIGAASVSGCFTSGTKAVYQGGNLMTVSYANLGYTPIIHTQWYDPTNNSSVNNDVSIIALQYWGNGQSKFYIEATSGNTNNGTILVTLLSPSLV